MRPLQSNEGTHESVQKVAENKVSVTIDNTTTPPRSFAFDQVTPYDTRRRSLPHCRPLVLPQGLGQGRATAGGVRMLRVSLHLCCDRFDLKQHIHAHGSTLPCFPHLAGVNASIIAYGPTGTGKTVSTMSIGSSYLQFSYTLTSSFVLATVHDDRGLRD